MDLYTINGRNVWKNPERKDPKNPQKRKTRRKSKETSPQVGTQMKPMKPSTSKKSLTSISNKLR